MSKIPRASEELLSFDSMYAELHKGFGKLEDHRRNNSSHSLRDIVSGAFAMFSLKSPSLLNFSLRSRQEEQNLMEVYKISKLCSDTQMRQVLDKVKAAKVRDLFGKVIGKVKNSAFFASYRYFKQMVVVSIDGVEHFSSQKVHCEHCLSKEHKSGQVTYSHAMLAVVLVHPHKREVLPLDAEPILRQDGCEKNDCERNAARRLVKHLKESYPKLKALLVEDALYANAAQLARAGRSRWKIENETFNTLKNQGYHFEHNYSHGQDQLSSVLAYLMLLAFRLDQTQQGACKTFRAIHAALKTKAKVWGSLRAVFKLLPCLSMQQAWNHVAHMYQVQLE